jgi:hypothetical protein
MMPRLVVQRIRRCRGPPRLSLLDKYACISYHGSIRDETMMLIFTLTGTATPVLPATPHPCQASWCCIIAGLMLLAMERASRGTPIPPSSSGLILPGLSKARSESEQTAGHI